MPHVEIKMFKGRDDELKKKVAEAVRDTMQRELNCDRSHLSVAIEDYKPEEWNEKVYDNVNQSNIYAGELFKNK